MPVLDAFGAGGGAWAAAPMKGAVAQRIALYPYHVKFIARQDGCLARTINAHELRGYRRCASAVQGVLEQRRFAACCDTSK